MAVGTLVPLGRFVPAAGDDGVLDVEHDVVGHRGQELALGIGRRVDELDERLDELGLGEEDGVLELDEEQVEFNVRPGGFADVEFVGERVGEEGLPVGLVVDVLGGEDGLEDFVGNGGELAVQQGDILVEGQAEVGEEGSCLIGVLAQAGFEVGAAVVLEALGDRGF